MSWTICTTLAALGLAVLSSPVAALETRIPVGAITTRTMQDGGTAVWLPVGGLRELEEEMVVWARLVLSGEVPSLDDDLRVSISWLPTGGDLPDQTRTIEVEIPKGADARILNYDVTELVREMAEMQRGGHGLLLHPAERDQAGFTRDEAAVFAGLSGGEIRIGYRKLTAYGVRGGPQALAERKARREMRGAAGGKRPAASGQR